MQGQSQQENVRKSNISCKDSPGLNWLDRWFADMPSEGRRISQPKFWVELLQCHHQLRVQRLHPHLSPHSLLMKFPLGKRLLQKAKLHEPNTIYQS
ncbi:hypothetical protein YC2023_078920 [Brassica napus]